MTSEADIQGVRG